MKFNYSQLSLYFHLFKTILLVIENFTNIQNAKEFEKQGVILAESGTLDQALDMFEKAIASSPTWASAYNNRAQALRLLKRNEGELFFFLIIC